MKKKIVFFVSAVVLIMIIIVCTIFVSQKDDGISSNISNDLNVSDENRPQITEDSLISKAKIGDYVFYKDDVGIGRWRIFDIKDEKVYIIPEFGAVGRLKLVGAERIYECYRVN